MSIQDNLRSLQDEISGSALRCGRKPEEIILIGVSKTFEEKSIIQAYEAGLTRFGESRVQEAERKIGNLKGYNMEWHLVGHLQSNKAGKAVDIFSCIQSLDKISTLQTVDHMAGQRKKVLDILIEVNVSGETSKSGIQPGTIKEFLENSLSFSNIRIKGLMTIGPLTGEKQRIKDSFLRLKEMFVQCRSAFPQLSLEHLSMGMSDDFRIAVECGSTMLRIGRRIFGERG